MHEIMFFGRIAFPINFIGVFLINDQFLCSTWFSLFSIIFILLGQPRTKAEDTEQAVEKEG